MFRRLLDRIPEIAGEMLMVWGRPDPHVPLEDPRGARGGRHVFSMARVQRTHAFLRDEGPRYNPVFAQQGYALALEMFQRRLAEGDLVAAKPASGGETKR